MSYNFFSHSLPRRLSACRVGVPAPKTRRPVDYRRRRRAVDEKWKRIKSGCGGTHADIIMRPCAYKVARAKNNSSLRRDCRRFYRFHTYTTILFSSLCPLLAQYFTRRRAFRLPGKLARFKSNTSYTTIFLFFLHFGVYGRREERLKRVGGGGQRFVGFVFLVPCIKQTTDRFFFFFAFFTIAAATHNFVSIRGERRGGGGELRSERNVGMRCVSRWRARVSFYVRRQKSLPKIHSVTFFTDVFDSKLVGTFFFFSIFSKTFARNYRKIT